MVGLIQSHSSQDSLSELRLPPWFQRGGSAPSGHRVEPFTSMPGQISPPLIGLPAANRPRQRSTLIGIDDVQSALNRSRASGVPLHQHRSRNLNPPFNPRRLNPEYRTDQRNRCSSTPRVARFARECACESRGKVTVEGAQFRLPTATQQLLGSILEELQGDPFLDEPAWKQGAHRSQQQRDGLIKSRPAA